MNHSTKLIWGCVAVVAVAVGIAALLADATFLLFAIPCMLMMGAMVWMMMGMGGGPGRGGPGG